MLFLITRMGIVFVSYLAVPLIADSTTPPPYHLRGTDNILIDVFGSRWDTGFYVSIAEEGYKYRDVSLPSVAFFPLYPLMMRALGFVIGDVLVAGIIISNLALLLAMILFYRLISLNHENPVANRGVWYMLIFPAAFFGLAVYTESLFIFFAIGALYFARRGFWEMAALFGIAVALTRFMGLIVAIMLLVEWIVQYRRKPPEKKPSYFAILSALVVPLGTIGYMLYLQQAFGDPLAFIKGAAVWERVPQSPLLTIAEQLKTPAEGWWRAILAGRVHIDNWIDFSTVLLFIIFGFILLNRRRWSEGAYVLAGVFFAFSSGLLMSQRRYMWVLFPAFVLLAEWGENPMVNKLITVIFLVGLVLFTALYANGYWVG